MLQFEFVPSLPEKLTPHIEVPQTQLYPDLYPVWTPTCSRKELRKTGILPISLSNFMIAEEQ